MDPGILSASDMDLEAAVVSKLITQNVYLGKIVHGHSKIFLMQEFFKCVSACQFYLCKWQAHRPCLPWRVMRACPGWGWRRGSGSPRAAPGADCLIWRPPAPRAARAARSTRPARRLPCLRANSAAPHQHFVITPPCRVTTLAAAQRAEPGAVNTALSCRLSGKKWCIGMARWIMGFEAV